jgi:gliding motility-associated-like protein
MLNNKSVYKIFFGLCCVLLLHTANAQLQSCPLNIDYSTNDLSHWFAYTGNNLSGNGPTAILKTYDSSAATPTGTQGATSISEYGINSPGIAVNTFNGVDPFGGYSTIPTINGFTYSYSIQLGSTAITSIAGGGSPKGGYVRGLSYSIAVPNGTGPYTMTYAYAMVLESAPHQTSQVPLFSAVLNTNSGSISCASAFYQLPTIRSGNSYVLDQAAAAKQGFSLSPVPSPNNNGNATESRNRVYTKGWTEVTFDLSAYRGQNVTLTFEADNCVPGGHFAYAYIAFRNNCGGLQITGPTSACSNSNLTYSIPALADATYTWTYPPGWTLAADSSNKIVLTPGNTAGTITVNEKNSCANLSASLNVNTILPTLAGQVSGNNSVCTGTNTSTLIVNGKRGNIINWLSSTDGINWKTITSTDSFYIAKNLTANTTYRALVQNGTACSIDTSAAAVVNVSAKSAGGNLSPTLLDICKGQNKGAILTLSGSVGSVVNWQSLSNTANTWNNFNPANTDTFFSISNVNTPTVFRVIVQSGACPADTSKQAQVNIYNALFPQAALNPAIYNVCFGDKAVLKANVTTGTNYTWLNSNSLYDPSGRTISSTPYTITAQVAPPKSTKYVLSVQNADCPHLWTDTFTVNIIPPIVISAGADTFVVAGQPLQLYATISDSTGLNYNWTPAYGLNDPAIYNPVSTLGTETDSITYRVTASNAFGCYGTANKKIMVFKTGPNIFVPSAFTPNHDGLNDLLKPITVGIKTFNYFRIYNRWGQLLFASADVSKGWDGNANGTMQQSGAYVYVAEGIDYKGNKVFKKGTVVLIR